MDGFTLILFVAGFVLLVFGAEWLVKGASRLAITMGVSPLIVGLTIVAFGTSAPELAVSIQAALTPVADGGSGADIAVGNIIGSNIFNILLILGLSAVIMPLIVHEQLIRKGVPFMIFISVLMYLLSMDGLVSQTDGIILFAGSLFYTGYLVLDSRRSQKAAIHSEFDDVFGKHVEPGWKSTLFSLLLVIVGVLLLVLGSRWLVDGAVQLAETLGISNLIIGLTVVAIGTSLPEVATSVMASIRGERDIAVGNVVGSNIFNILLVLGLSAAITPGGIGVSASALSFDIPVMLAVTIACLPIFFSGNEIARWEGFLFLGYFVAYILYLVLYATEHDLLPMFSAVMIWFIMPITVITIGLIAYRSFKKKNNV